jgi:hypothetical protein
MDRCNQNNVTDSDEQEAIMVRYLLGQSPEEERSHVEERYFSDGAYFDQLLALEDSLIDDFVSGRMPADQLNAFKESESIRQHDIRFSRALFHAAIKKKLDQPAPEPEHRLPLLQRLPFVQTRRFLLAVSTGAIVLVVLSGALFLRNKTLQNRLTETEAQLGSLKEEKEAAEHEASRALSQTESSARELEIEHNKRIDAENLLQRQGRRGLPRVSSDLMTIVLGAAFTSRGATGAIREAHIPENVRSLRFEIPAKGYGAFDSYHVSIKLAGQGEVFARGSLKRTGVSRQLTVTVPSANLPPGDYILTLSGESAAAPPAELEQYSFRITG